MSTPEILLYTPYLGEVILLAQQFAADSHRCVGVDDLLAAAIFGNDPSCRCRLVLHWLGADRNLEQQTYIWASAVQREIDSASRAVEFSADAAAVLERMKYWSARTGDHSADTAHLLLAALEFDNTVGHVLTGATTNDLVRTALTVRSSISSRDRHVGHRPPILSPRRSNRPETHAFEAIPEEDSHFRTYNSMTSRSQIAGRGHMSSRIQRHLVRLSLLVTMLELLALAALVTSAIYVAVTDRWWALLWLVCILRRDRLGVKTRMSIDLGVLVCAIMLGFAFWPIGVVLSYRVLDIAEERIGVLQARSAVADPDLSARSLRADRRVNQRAANKAAAEQLQRKLKLG
ncbi:hypothetical protein ACFVUS_27820 [Nocardia sp. NPDC058058]|uniref:hypothetical protein n=1 Tax=Nocardia sp. NPDC058058 TaxID=3346317 RepID=UPI0036DB80D0